MANLELLRVSLTKNGYLKLAKLVKRHPRFEVLENVRGVYPGVNLVRSQVANIMGEDLGGEVPEFWDDLRQHSEETIKLFVIVAVIMSHGELVQVLGESVTGRMRGCLRRARLSEKVYTNLVYSFAECGLCEYVRGADQVEFDMRGLVHGLERLGHPLRELFEHKLRKSGWRPLGRPGGTDLLTECASAGVPAVFGLEDDEFAQWIYGRLRVNGRATSGKPDRPR